MTVRLSPLAPFRVTSFRFQWPADLLTSWAFEMETLVLGWYVLVETDSVLLLTVFGSLQFLGTLVAPMFGVVGDRVGRHHTLCGMRVTYTLLAGILMLLAMTDVLVPTHVFVIAVLMGLVRPSDLVMRFALIGDTMPTEQLASAMGISRMTMDSARIAGALLGAGLFIALGMGWTYVIVTALYAASFLLTLGVSRVRPTTTIASSGAFADLWKGFGYIWAAPTVLAIMWLAFLVNFSAYPLSNGLLPYVAKQIYAVDQDGLSHLVAAFAVGALAGSILLTIAGNTRRAGRLMLYGCWAWYAALLVFGFLESKLPGVVVLLIVGFAQSLCMISMAVTLLHSTQPEYRGRVQGVRMLAVYGLPVGLVLSGFVIEWVGFPATIAIYSIGGLVLSGLIALKWRLAIWHG
ncbi:MAG: MFS transporter [Alphaproteobacteria bacterium]